MEDNQYKSIDNAFTKQLKSDLEMNMDKFRDPIVIGELVYRLLEERENTNRILKNVLAKLEALEAGHKTTIVQEHTNEILLPEIDEQIMTFVRKSGKVTAEEVREKFHYRGKNAASARLNRLCDSNLLRKMQVGKKVFFFPV